MDGAVTIREFAWDDYPEVIALWQRVFGGIKPEDERPALARTLERNPGLFLVVPLVLRLVLLSAVAGRTPAAGPWPAR